MSTGYFCLMAKSLIDYLINNAPNGICQDGVAEIKQANCIDDFLSIYLKYIDFCLSENFPTNSDLIKYGNDRLIDNGIYIDEKPNILNRNTAVLLGNSNGVGQYLWCSVGHVYMKGKSKLDLLAKDNAFIIVDIFDDAQLNIKTSGNAKALVNIYGNAKVYPSQADRSTIKIVNKQKTNY